MAQPDHSPAEFSETHRQIEHIVPVAFAFLLRWLPPVGAAVLVLCGVAYALFGSCRLAPSSFREEERQQRWSRAKVLYACSILVLIAAFPRHLHVVAGAWAVMAVGDGCAPLVGGRCRRAFLPWNRRKTWLGLAAFVVAGGMAAAVALVWVGGRYGDRLLSAREALRAALAAAAAAGVVESLPIERWIDDNVTVPLCSAAVLYLMIGGPHPGPF